METSQIKTLYTLKQNANEHLKNKKFSHAVVYFNDILLKFNQSIEKIQSEDDMEKVIKQIKLPSHKNLALCYLKLNEYRLSVKHSEEALQIEPNNLKMIYRIGKAFIGLKQYDSAQKYLKRGFAIDPNQEQILKALQEIQVARNSKKKSQQSCLKKLIAIILYFPLLILNTILGKIFGNSVHKLQKPKQN